MHHHHWILWQLTQERWYDLVREAEQERLTRRVSSSHPQLTHSVYHVLDRLGQQLIVWGEQLQARHAAIHTRSLIQTSRGES